MKKAIVVVGVLVTVLLGCCSVVGVESPINKDIIDYRDSDEISFEGEEQVNLSYISSDLYESALLVELVDFYPAENRTVYECVSLEILIESNFTADIKDFFYQDMNTGQIYIMSVDYSGVEVPEDQRDLYYQQLEIDYGILVMDYENLMSDYENLTLMVIELQSNFSLIEMELSNYTNVSGVPLENVTRALVSSYFDLVDLLNQTKEELNSTEIELSETVIEFLNLQDNHTDLVLAFTTLNESYNELNETYNITYNSLSEANVDLSEYENFTNRLNSADEGEFYFRGDYYRSFSYYQNKIGGLEEEVGRGLIYIGIAVVIMVIIVIFIIKLISGKKPQSGLESDYGYDEKAGSILNKYGLSGKTKANPDYLDSKIDEKISQLKQYTDGELDTMRQDISRIHDTVDRLINKK